jgi:phosphate-selective porin OprO/OprP
MGLRELRLTLTGTGYEVFDYKAEFALSSMAVAVSNADGVGQATAGTVVFNDLWIGAKNVPLLGYFRVGHYNLEISPAYLAGTSHNTLIETTAPATSFFLARRLGMSSEHLFAQDRIRWFVGVFQGRAINNARSITDDNQGYILNTRLTAAPFYANGGRQVLHVGGSYAYVEAPLPGISAYLGGSNWLPTTLTTGQIRSRQHHRSGIELAYQSGPFAVKSEGFFTQYGRVDEHRMARGASVELSYFLTGEHRAYNLATGTFGAATVNRPFRPFKSGHWNLVDGLGAWQFVTQYCYVDLTDWRSTSTTNGNVTGRYGGYQHDLTFGVNWFWNSNLRWVFAYTRSQQNIGADRRYCYQDIFGVSARVHW